MLLVLAVLVALNTTAFAVGDVTVSDGSEVVSTGTSAVVIPMTEADIDSALGVIVSSLVDAMANDLPSQYSWMRKWGAKEFIHTNFCSVTGIPYEEVPNSTELLAYADSSAKYAGYGVVARIWGVMGSVSQARSTFIVLKDFLIRLLADKALLRHFDMLVQQEQKILQGTNLYLKKGFSARSEVYMAFQAWESRTEEPLSKNDRRILVSASEILGCSLPWEEEMDGKMSFSGALSDMRYYVMASNIWRHTIEYVCYGLRALIKAATIQERRSWDSAAR